MTLMGVERLRTQGACPEFIEGLTTSGDKLTKSKCIRPLILSLSKDGGIALERHSQHEQSGGPATG